MATTSALLTAEDYFNLPDQGKHTELVRGELVMMNMPGALHGLVCLNIGGIIQAYVRERKLGRAFGNDAGVITARNPDSVRGPGIAFYSYARMPKGKVTTGYPPAAL